jgi:hypothetical protein
MRRHWAHPCPHRSWDQGSSLPTPAPLPHQHREWAHPCPHRTRDQGSPLPTSAPRLGSPLPTCELGLAAVWVFTAESNSTLSQSPGPERSLLLESYDRLPHCVIRGACGLGFPRPHLHQGLTGLTPPTSALRLRSPPHICTRTQPPTAACARTCGSNHRCQRARTHTHAHTHAYKR